MEQELRAARNKCYQLLAVRPRTEYEITTALKKKDFSLATINAVLAELKKDKLVDDELYAGNWLRWRLSSKLVGPDYIKSDLLKKGVAVEIIEKVLLNYDEKREYETALLAACKCTGQGAVGQRKLPGFLARRGFSYNIIIRVVKRASSGQLDMS